MRLKSAALLILFIIWLVPAPAYSEDFCVSTAAEFQTALTEAQNNGEGDIIKLVQNVYVGNFLYASTKGHGLTIEGGYSGGCGTRTIDPENSVLRDSVGDLPVLALTDLSLIAPFIIEAVKLERIDDSPSEPILYGKGAVHEEQIETSAFYLKNCVISGDNYSESSTSHGISMFEFDKVSMLNNIVEGNIWATDLEYIRHSIIFKYNMVRYSALAFRAGYCRGDIDIEENTVYDNGPGIYVVAGFAGNLYKPNITAKQNNIYNNLGNGLYLNGSKVNVLNNDLVNNYGNGVLVYSDDLVSIANNYIDRSTNGSGVAVFADSCLIVNNLISNGSNTIEYHPIYLNPSVGGGIYLECVNSCNIISNTIVNNFALQKGGGIYFTTDYGSNPANIYNNIIFNNQSPQGSQLYIINDKNEDFFSNNVNLFNNLFNQDAASAYIQRPITINGSNLDNSHPQFVDSDIDDYHILRTSPCLDSGSNSAPQLPDTDLDGITRIQNNVVEIGCYEMKSPLAGFYADRTRGFRPLQVQFQSTCYGNVSSFYWQFGDGATSAEPSPVHEYDEYGRYSVSLQVVGTDGTDLITKCDYISVVAFPVGVLSILLAGGN